MISNCGHDENGRYSGGRAGDQTGTEWAVIPWYDRPWNCVIRHPDRNVGDMIAKLAKEAAENNLIGYDQGERGTFWKQLSVSGMHPSNIKTACEADCSSGVAAIVKATGHLLNFSRLRNVSADMYTGNERNALKEAGFQVLTDSRYLTSDAYLIPGDILLYEYHHTAINLSTGLKAQDKGEHMFTVKSVPTFEQKGTSVLLLQEILRARGFKDYEGNEIGLDQDFGPKTKSALIKLQEAHKKGGHNMRTDGICDEACWKILLAM